MAVVSLTCARTHRERKEQYIKALETEVSHLRELFAKESQTVQTLLKHKDMQIREREQENFILRDMLTSRGIPYEGELQRKLGGAMGGQANRSMSPSYTMPQAHPFTNIGPTALSSSEFSFLQEPNFGNGAPSSTSGHSPVGTHHASSPSEIQEQGTRMMLDPRVPDAPGVFEKDPQLGIDFILASV